MEGQNSIPPKQADISGGLSKQLTLTVFVPPKCAGNTQIP
jgi:hypothetical protein